MSGQKVLRPPTNSHHHGREIRARARALNFTFAATHFLLLYCHFLYSLSHCGPTHDKQASQPERDKVHLSHEWKLLRNWDPNKLYSSKQQEEKRLGNKTRDRSCIQRISISSRRPRTEQNRDQQRLSLALTVALCQFSWWWCSCSLSTTTARFMR